MTVEENKANVRRWVEEVWSSQDGLRSIEELVEPDMIADDTDPHTMTVRDIAQAMRLFRAAFPDWQAKTGAVVAEGEEVMLRWTAHGTHTGTMQGIAAREAIAEVPGSAAPRPLLLVPPTGRRVTIEGACHFTFRDGKVLSFWVLWDQVELMRQIGVLPAAGATYQP